MTTTDLRHATFPELVSVLQDVEARKLDVIAAGPALRMDDNGNIVVPNTGDAVLSDDGVETADGTFAPLSTFEETAAPRLDIPLAYWRRCPTELRATNVNHWLQSQPDRKFLVRLLSGADGTTGVARALLSNSYRVIDHLDVTLAMLDGIRSAGIDPSAIKLDADLTSRRLQIRVVAPGVAVQARDLVDRYSHQGLRGKDAPLIFAGLVASNSETGGGAWTITPRIEVQVCTNGMTRTKDAVRSIHVGGKLSEGVIDWSLKTRQAEIELIRGQARDAVMHYLNVDYVTEWVDELRGLTTQRVTEPIEAVKIVARQLAFSEAASDEIMGWFIDGGDSSAFGLVQAVTAWAKETSDVEASIAAEAGAVDAVVAALR